MHDPVRCKTPESNSVTKWSEPPVHRVRFTEKIAKVSPLATLPTLFFKKRLGNSAYFIFSAHCCCRQKILQQFANVNWLVFIHCAVLKTVMPTIRPVSGTAIQSLGKQLLLQNFRSNHTRFICTILHKIITVYFFHCNPYVVRLNSLTFQCKMK